MNPSLDVVIPCYNAAETLYAAVESALRQHKVNTVWLVDDASQDHTRAVMAELAAQYPNVCCEYLVRNGGAAKARNWGMLQSEADFIAFLDADDVYEAGALAAAYAALCSFHYLSLVRLKLHPVGFPTRYTQHAGFAEAWRRLEMTVGGNTVFRRSILLSCGGFPQDGLFRRFGGEYAALGISLTRSSVVGTLFGAKDAGVRHVYRKGIHAERLLDAAIFGINPAGIGERHQAEAEAVTQRICNRLGEIGVHLSFGQTGIMEVQVSYGE